MLSLEEKIKVFKALGNKTRFEIFRNVLSSPYICGIDTKVKSDDIVTQATCVGMIADKFNYSLPTISKHIKELKDAKIINMNKVGNKIYLEPNFKTIKEIKECFNSIANQ
jgi:ArsR family transcriptional regulator